MTDASAPSAASPPLRRGSSGRLPLHSAAAHQLLASRRPSIAEMMADPRADADEVAPELRTRKFRTDFVFGLARRVGLPEVHDRTTSGKLPLRMQLLKVTTATLGAWSTLCARAASSRRRRTSCPRWRSSTRPPTSTIARLGCASCAPIHDRVHGGDEMRASRGKTF